jgi:DNA topoisomerase-1
MALKKGRFGAFYGCSGYPECKNIRKIDKKSGIAQTVAAPVTLDEKCPKDGANLVVRQGRFGEFTSCSNYPKCDYIKRETLGIPCPKCKDGEIAVKKSKARQSVLRLYELPEVRRRILGQTNRRALPEMQRAVCLSRRRRKKKERSAIAKPTVVIIKSRSAM